MIKRELIISALVVFLATAAVAGPINAVSGVTGVDGQLPTVQGLVPAAIGDPIVALGGDITAYFVGWAAADQDMLQIDGSDTFWNQGITPLGASVDLGYFAPGQILTIALVNQTAGETWYYGPGTQNPDGAVHDYQAPWSANLSIPVNGLFLGGEDLPITSLSTTIDGNDLMAVLSNVCGEAPEPGSSTLAAIGFVLFGFGVWKRRRVVACAAVRASRTEV